MDDQVVLVAHLHELTNDFLHHCLPAIDFSKVWSHWAFLDLLHEDIHKSIKYSWTVEELLNLRLFVRNINQVQREVLVQCHVTLLVLQKLLSSRIVHSRDTCLINFPVLWQSKSCHIVGNSQSIFPRLNAKCLAWCILFFFIASKHN